MLRCSPSARPPWDRGIICPAEVLLPRLHVTSTLSLYPPQYYDLPTASMRDAVWKLIMANATGFKVRGARGSRRVARIAVRVRAWCRRKALAVPKMAVLSVLVHVPLSLNRLITTSWRFSGRSTGAALHGIGARNRPKRSRGETTSTSIPSTPTARRATES